MKISFLFRNLLSVFTSRLFIIILIQFKLKRESVNLYNAKNLALQKQMN